MDNHMASKIAVATRADQAILQRRAAHNECEGILAPNSRLGTRRSVILLCPYPAYQTSVEQAVILLMEKLEKFLLKTLSGETIFTASSLFLGVMDRLRTINKVPHDVETRIPNAL
jgi:hypothetical protein